ncbi:hypothetical protein AK830_g10640 [Neonectria ditissima]|uniref:Zeta toxin domain-containing protein n=1 Tax=Neonectria ditissima TaxID=78410 RepID=A0A0N8H5E3_9HYPO|nr:hypothetical protein AK830_g10640 [Neonectria ditissima]
MSGAPGSGKSTIAAFLAQSIDAVVINHDLIKAFFLENDVSFERSAKLTYGFDWILAEDVIKQGRNVIIDSACYFNEILDQGTALAAKYGYEYTDSLRSQRTGVDCPPPDAESTTSDKDSRVLFKRWIESPCRPSGHVIFVDSSRSLEDGLATILEQLVLGNGEQADTHPTTRSLDPEYKLTKRLEPCMYP